MTGGWVMTDEANAHYFSIITELLEGHEWVRNHLGKSFSFNSFNVLQIIVQRLIGQLILSVFLLHFLFLCQPPISQMQLFKGLLLFFTYIQLSFRVHYSIKKHLAKNKQLEFMWRQMWGSHGAADVRAHVFPFYSYDVPHTCGPEPAVCCQFDFRSVIIC